MNSSLSNNGAVLTGADLEEYCKRKGLCRICARVVTHKRAGKLIRRNQWQPLTIQNESTGEYLVYKGCCISATCYTLDQAKASLGEKPTSARKSFCQGSVVRGLAPLGGKDAIGGSGRMLSHYSQHSSGGSSRRRAAYKSDSYRRDNGGRPSQYSSRRISDGSSHGSSHRRALYQSESFRDKLSPSGSVYSMADSVSSARYSGLHKWSREIPSITLPSLNSSHHTGSETPTGTEDDRNVDKELSGAIANLASVLYSSKNEKNKSHSKATTQSAQGTSATPSLASFHSVSTSTLKDKKKQGGKPKKSMALKLFPGLKKNLKTKGDDHTLTSSASSITSSDSITLDDLSLDHPIELPGSGFVAGGPDGNYRAALEALDLAGGQGNQRIKDMGDFQALCLQSKQLDSLDIEMVAVEVDARNRHWMSQEFVLEDDDFTVWDFDHEHRVEQDLTGLHMVHLSHVYCGGFEELELEADLNDFEALERVRISDAKDKAGADFLAFRTRVSLEIEISKCEGKITEAEQSDEPSAIQEGIDAQQHLDMLLPLRKFYLSRKELEKKIKRLTRAISRLGGDDLDRRYYLATQKEQLASQVEEEKREEELHLSKSNLQEKALEGVIDSSELEAKEENDGKSTGLTTVEAATTGMTEAKSDASATAFHKTTKITTINDNMPRESFGRGVEVNMTVFQSAPLAYVDHSTGTHHVCPLLDFEYEGRALTQSLKDAENAGAKIEFDIATTDRLGAFLAKSESRVMHLSCHGHPDYLALEDGFGGMQILPVRDLKRFIASGAGNLEVVFVSACHSKAAGTAFLNAGIRHVICCRQDDKFRDEGAIEFARSFYRALALNNTVKQAFKMAREAMRISPMVKDSKAEYEKFILLPEVPDNDPYHDVHIFTNNLTNKNRRFTKKSSLRPRQELQKKQMTTRILPRVPQYFVGREMTMYTILDALRSNDLVSIQGPPEIGKTSLVAALSRYIQQRHKSFLFDDVFWLPVQEGSIPPEDKLCLDLSRIFEMIKRASTAPCQLDRGYADCWGRVLRKLHDKRVLLVVHGRSLTSKGSIASLEGFLRDLLRVSNAKVITVGVPVLKEAGSTSTIIDVEPLDYDSSVLLFARHTRSSALSSSQIVKALTSVPSCKNNASREKLVAVRRRRTFERIGEGVPAEIRRAALDMSDENMLEILQLAGRPLMDVNCRADIETNIVDLEEEETLELKENNFLKARDIQESIKELQSLRQAFPTLEELQSEAEEVEQALKRAVSDKYYDDANHLQKRLVELKDQISKELTQAGDLEALERLSSF